LRNIFEIWNEVITCTTLKKRLIVKYFNKFISKYTFPFNQFFDGNDFKIVP